MQYVHVVVGRRDLIGEFARAVGAVVVGHQHVGRRHRRPQSTEGDRQAVAFLVGRDDHDDPAEVARPRHPLVTSCGRTRRRAGDVRTPLRSRTPR